MRLNPKNKLPPILNFVQRRATAFARLKHHILVLPGALLLATSSVISAQPNVLLITVDDMNADSVGAFGCPVPETTPHLDRLAAEGMRFEHAHVIVANCSPSRNVIQTGRYPQVNGVEGFYDVAADFPILPDLLKAAGYRTGIWGKVADSTPESDYAWDEVLKTKGRGSIKNAQEVQRITHEFIAGSQEKRQPFYLIINISDPHHPLFNSERARKNGHDDFPPSRIFTKDEVVIPGFLPDLPEVRQDVTNYYNSVRRADDLIGATLSALETSGESENTIVMFLSDHGMPFPFAKTNLYHHSTRTPWIVRIPNLVQPGTTDREHMISTIDYMPTILELCGLAAPEGLNGRSFAPLLTGGSQDGREFVFKEFHENARGIRNPMRAVESKRFGYIFNPWSDGTRIFRSATLHAPTYKAMQAAARNDSQIAARIQHFNHRTVEEFYDYQEDPDARVNLIDDPRYAGEIERLRTALAQWMTELQDPALSAFENRQDPKALKAFIQQEDASSKARLNSGVPRKRE